MRWLLAAMLASLVLAAAPAHAQLPERYSLHLESATVAQPLAWDGTAGRITVAWTLSCVTTASQAPPGQQGTVTFATEAPLLLGNATQQVQAPDCIVTHGVHVATVLPVSAAPEARGDASIRVPLRAHYADGFGTVAAQDVAVEFRVTFHGALNATAGLTTSTTGPQRQLVYPVLVRNDGNARAQVEFSLVNPPGRGWQAVVPAPVLLAPGDRKEVSFVVATPYQNGPNSGSATLHLLVRAHSTLDGNAVSPPTELVFLANVHGLYVPGPPLPLVLVALAGFAVALRHRAWPHRNGMTDPHRRTPFYPSTGAAGPVRATGARSDLLLVHYGTQGRQHREGRAGHGEPGQHPQHRHRGPHRPREDHVLGQPPRGCWDDQPRVGWPAARARLRP